jgi:membrane-bound serine protease (ClpP class)
MGIILIITAILMAMIQHYPGDPWYPSLPQLSFSVIEFSKSLLLSAVGFALVAGLLPKTRMFRTLVLDSTISRTDGFTAAPDTASLVGRQGVTETRLNPAGAARFGTQRLNVVTRGDFYEVGEAIVIAEARGSRIIVERIKKA